MTFDPNQVKIGLVKDMDSAFLFLDWIRTVPDQLIGLDVETAGLGWYDGKLRLVQFGTMTEGWAVPYQENRLLVREALDILSKRDKFFVLHNAKFDIHFLERSTGWVPKDWRYIHDTLLMGTVLNSAAAKGLKDLAEFYVWSGAKLGEEALKQQFRKHGWFWDTVPVDLPEYWIYGVLDTIMTVNLFYILHRLCDDAQVMGAYEVELGVLPALYNIEKNGMLLDSEHCHKYIDQLSGRAAEIESMVFERYGIENLNSTNQLALALLREGVVLTERTKTGWKMDKETFELLAATQNHPLLAITTEYRSATRMASTYFGNFLQHQRSDGRCHPFYWATEAKTGRMSATEPAIQTVPRPDDDKAEFVKEVRNSFVAPEGSYYVSCDFSNMEARVFADFADEEGMKKAFLEELNLHMYTASQIFDRPYDSIEKTHSEYTVAKNTLFCLPETTKALTQCGPKSIDELQVGDMVAGINGWGIEWTPIRAIHRPGEQEVVTFGNKHRQFRATGNHRWVSERRINNQWQRETITTDEFLGRHTGDQRLNVSAQWVVEDRSGLTPSQCALLGWLITDGHVRWSDCTSGRTSQAGGTKVGVQGRIAQTRPTGRYWIKRDLEQFIRHEDDNGFDIYPQPIRDIFSITGLERDYSNIYDLVLSMGWEQVTEFMGAAFRAEGYQKGNRISQNEGPRYDAIRLACFMAGNYPGRGLIVKSTYKTDNVCRQFTRGLPTMTGARVKVLDRKVEPVWCITTDLDSFVAVDGDDYFLTGNCTLFGGGEAQIAITAKIPIEKAREAKRGLYLKFPNMPIFQSKMARMGEDNLYAHGIAYIRGIDGRILAMKEGDARYYAFTNWLIQSSSCTILKKSLTTMHNMGWSEFMVAAIHDEILGEVPEDLVPDYRIAVREAMTDNYLLSVPIVCAVGEPAQRWGDAK